MISPNDQPGQPADERGAFDLLRHRMVADQLKRRGIRDERVLRAMEQVPREHFVPEQYRQSAYDDCALPIGHGQTISQPFTVAFMIEALRLTGDEKVLDVGTGSGYGAAVLSHLAREVHSVERIAELGRRATNVLARLGYENVHTYVSDGTLGLPDEAPFDAIIVAAGAETLPKSYVDQLRDGGRIVIPLGSRAGGQSMFRFTLREGELRGDDLGGFAFVPLIGRYGWDAAGADDG